MDSDDNFSLSSLSPTDAAESDHEQPSEALLRSSILDDDSKLIIGVDANLNSVARLSDDDDLSQINPSLRTTGGERLILPSTRDPNTYSPFSIDSGIGSLASLMSVPFNELNQPATSDDWMNLFVESETEEPPEEQVLDVEPSDDDDDEEPESSDDDDEEPESSDDDDEEPEPSDDDDEEPEPSDDDKEWTMDYVICEVNCLGEWEVLAKWTSFPVPQWTLTKYVDEDGSEMKRFRAHMDLFNRWKVTNGVHEPASYGKCLGQIGALIAQSRALPTNDCVRVCFNRIFYNPVPRSDESTHLFLFNVESYVNSFANIEHDLTEDLKFNTAELKSIATFLGQLLDGKVFEGATEVHEVVANGPKLAAKRRKKSTNREVVEVPVAGPSGLQRRVSPRLTERVVQKPQTASKSRKRTGAQAKNLQNTAKRPKEQLPAGSKEQFDIDVILFQKRNRVLVKWDEYTEATWEQINKNNIDPKGITMKTHRDHVGSFTAWKKRHADDNFETVLHDTAISLANISRLDIKELYTARIDELIGNPELLVPEVVKWFLFNLDCCLNFVPDQDDEKYDQSDLETICKFTMNLVIPN